jgi:hypothetical protein
MWVQALTHEPHLPPSAIVYIYIYIGHLFFFKFLKFYKIFKVLFILLC